jgi:hypothetical protein
MSWFAAEQEHFPPCIHQISADCKNTNLNFKASVTLHEQNRTEQNTFVLHLYTDQQLHCLFFCWIGNCERYLLDLLFCWIFGFKETTAANMRPCLSLIIQLLAGTSSATTKAPGIKETNVLRKHSLALDVL